MKYKITSDEALAKLKEQDKLPFVIMTEHGTMSIEYFAPKGTDTQTPHKQDEIYVIIEGQSTFDRNGEKISCKKHDILFVPAGMGHHFEDFSDDFASWVIFYGPEGGEQGGTQ